MRLGLSHSRMRLSRTMLCLSVFVFIILLVCFFIVRLQPAFFKYAQVYANNMANKVVNDSVNEVFSKEEYENLASITENTDKNVRTIETDTAKINKLKSEINQSIIDNINSLQTDTVYIPLGSATEFYFLAGLGPKIPIRIYPVSIVNTDFKEDFESVGINQVKYKLYLEASIQMSFVGLTFAKDETIQISTLLTETIIVGDTPNYYGSGNITAAVK